MRKLERNDLYSLEEYAGIRNDFRKKIMQHKKNRQLPVGPNATLYFEDLLTIQYQIQEMLRAERIFEANGIQEEINAYTSLIPDGGNWKATFMIEFEDVDERRKNLKMMIGIEKSVWVEVENFPRIFSIADEDLERSTNDKTSSVHFLRFELEREMVNALKSGALLSAGIDLASYQYTVKPVPENIRQSLLADLD